MAKAETLDKPLFAGIIASESEREIRFEFNQKKRGWDYNVQLTKNSANAKHAFFVYVFAPLSGSGGEDCLICVGVYHSPTFTVLYRNRSQTSASSPTLFASDAPPNAQEEAEDASSPRSVKRPQIDEEERSEHEEEEELEMERRMGIILPMLYKQFAVDAKPDFFQAVVQEKPDWLLLRDDPASGGEEEEDFVLPSPFAFAQEEAECSASSLIAQLATYLVEEKTLSASMRHILASNLDKTRMKRAVLRTFHQEIATFLRVHGYTARDLDLALSSETAQTMDEPDAHVAHLVDHLAKIVLQESKAKAALGGGGGNVHPSIDLSGEWELDDVLIEAVTEARLRRGVPVRVCEMLKQMQREITLVHSKERILLSMKQNKLFSSLTEEFVLNGVEQPLTRSFPIPMSGEAFSEEVAMAFMDGNTAKQYRTYGGRVRVFMSMRRSGENQLVMNLEYAEKREETGDWETVLAWQGYGARKRGS